MNQSSITKKIGYSMLAFVIVATTIVAAVFGFYKSNIGKDINIQANDPQSNSGIFDGEGNSLNVGEVHSMPKSLLFATAAAETGDITLSATIYPANALIKDILWSIDWVDATADFAVNKTASTFVEITPTNNLIKIKYKAPFGAQIKLTATSVDNVSATAECVIDCAKRAKLTNLSMKNADTGEINTFESSRKEGNSIYLASINVNRNNTIKFVPQVDVNYLPYTYDVEDSVEYHMTAVVRPFLDMLKHDNPAYKLDLNDSITINPTNGICFDSVFFASFFGVDAMSDFATYNMFSEFFNISLSPERSNSAMVKNFFAKDFLRTQAWGGKGFAIFYFKATYKNKYTETTVNIPICIDGNTFNCMAPVKSVELNNPTLVI